MQTKTPNTNFALLVSKKFTEPFKEPIKYVGSIVASLAKYAFRWCFSSKICDLLDGKRSTPQRIKESIIKPTLECATPGDFKPCLLHTDSFYQSLKCSMRLIKLLQVLLRVIPFYIAWKLNSTLQG